MRPGRFERRILFAILLVVVGSLAGSFGMGYVVVHDAFSAGVNDQVRAALDQGVAARRAHLVTLRELTERTADWLAGDARLLEAIARDDRPAADARLREALGQHGAFVRAVVRRGDDELARAERPARTDQGPLRELRRVRPLALSAPSAVERSAGGDVPIEALPADGTAPAPAPADPVDPVDPAFAPDDAWGEPSDAAAGELEVEVVVAEPERTFTSFQEAGETARLLGRLSAQRRYVSNVYVAVYVAAVGLVALSALGVGLVLSRRATRNIGVLAEATKRVAAMDLEVVVPVRSDDEIGELTAAFNQMVRDLREQRARIDTLQRISAWQDFARRLAHEIKNPLTPIKLAAQEVQRSCPTGDEAYRRKVDQAVEIIEEEVATLRRLVTEFSNFSRLPEASLAPADLGEVVREFQRTAETREATATPVELRFEVPSRPIPVALDPMMFRRALDNLVRNAEQATRDQAGAGRVRVALRVEGAHAVLDVEDDGPGIVESDRARIFDPYYTTKADGTGLGLPIVMKVVLEHGGHIDLARGTLPGACFRVTLPLLPSP